MSDNSPGGVSPADRLRDYADRLERMRQENQESMDEFSRPDFFRSKVGSTKEAE